MYDYGNTKRYPIENVDHEIHIMGVKIGYFPYLLWSFLIGLMVGGPLMAIGGVVLVILLLRHLYFQELRGLPVTFQPRILGFLSRLPKALRLALVSMIPILGSIEIPRKVYRE